MAEALDTARGPLMNIFWRQLGIDRFDWGYPGETSNAGAIVAEVQRRFDTLVLAVRGQLAAALREAQDIDDMHRAAVAGHAVAFSDRRGEGFELRAPVAANDAGGAMSAGRVADAGDVPAASRPSTYVEAGRPAPGCDALLATLNVLASILAAPAGSGDAEVVGQANLLGTAAATVRCDPRAGTVEITARTGAPASSTA